MNFLTQVSLRQKDADDWHFCGGSVLDETHIITAAHCSVIWDSPTEVEVVAGRVGCGVRFI